MYLRSQKGYRLVLPLFDEEHGNLEESAHVLHPELGVATLSDTVGLDLSTYPLDGPLPEVPLTNTQQGRQRVVIDLARRERLTIRHLYQRVSGARAHRSIYSTATEIADSLELWYRSGAADGFNIMSLTFPEGLRDFIDHVIPELQRRRAAGRTSIRAAPRSPSADGYHGSHRFEAHLGARGLVSFSLREHPRIERPALMGG